MKETAKYRITGLVDQYDEQGVAHGQYPIGSIQELPVEQGLKEVAEGRAEAVALEEGTADTVNVTSEVFPNATGETGESGEDEEDEEVEEEIEEEEDEDEEEKDAPTGETGEGEVE